MAGTGVIKHTTQKRALGPAMLPTPFLYLNPKWGWQESRLIAALISTNYSRKSEVSTPIVLRPLVRSSSVDHHRYKAKGRIQTLTFMPYYSCQIFWQTFCSFEQFCGLAGVEQNGQNWKHSVGKKLWGCLIQPFYPLLGSFRQYFWAMANAPCFPISHDKAATTLKAVASISGQPSGLWVVRWDKFHVS